MIKGILLTLVFLGEGTNQLLAITPELQTKVDEIFKEREKAIEQAKFSKESKKIYLDFLEKEKREVEALPNEKIEKIISYYN